MMVMTRQVQEILLTEYGITGREEISQEMHGFSTHGITKLQLQEQMLITLRMETLHRHL